MAYFTTPIGIARYPHLIEPDTKGQYADDKYKVDLILTKQELADLKKRFIEVSGLTEKNRFPIGVDKEDESIMFLKLKSKHKPLLIDANGMDLPVDAKVSIGSGSKIRAIAEIYPYNTAGQKGVSLRLKSIQIISLVEGSRMGFDKVEGGYEYVPEDEEGDVETALDL